MISGPRGLTLLETVVALTAILAVFLMGYALWASASSQDEFQRARLQIQMEGLRALKEIAETLKQAGIISFGNGESYPYYFINGAAQAPFAYVTHDPVQSREADPDLIQEIVFRMPLADQNGMVVDPNTLSLAWDARVLAFVVVTASDGVNELRRRTYDQGNQIDERTLARHIDFVSFMPDAQDPAQVGIALWFYKPLPKGAISHRMACQARLRN